MAIYGPRRHTPSPKAGSQPDANHGVCATCGDRISFDLDINRYTGKIRGWRHRRRSVRPQQAPEVAVTQPVEPKPEGDVFTAILDELRAIRRIWEA
jgi:hypothetical protein